MSKRLIYEEDAIDAVRVFYADECALVDSIEEQLEKLPSAQPEGYIKIPETGIDDLSDGFHTFRQLYYQRMMLFATIVKQNKDKAWKSLRHEDGELCFGGGWFIVGIDTPEGSYTYHYEDNYFSLFDCEELERGKHWDGHTEKDVTRLLSLPSAQPEDICSECDAWNVYKNYTQPQRIKGKWDARGWNDTYWKCSNCDELTVFPFNFCPNCGADMRTKETDYDYERAVEQLEHDILYEPTFNQDDGSM